MMLRNGEAGGTIDDDGEHENEGDGYEDEGGEVNENDESDGDKDID